VRVGAYPAAAGAVLALAAALLLPRLALPLTEPEEARYAAIPREMTAAGAVLVPVLDGQPYLDKPPLLYWLVQASYAAFGVRVWAARLPAVLAAWATVAVVLAWGRVTGAPWAGVAGALILTLSGDFVYRGPMLTMNGLLGLCITAALALGHRALIGPVLAWRWWLAAAAATALGLMAKGPVALVLVAVPLALAPRVTPGVVRPGAAGWGGFLAAVLLLAGPWFTALAWFHPEFVGYFFWKHHVERFLRPFDHPEPFWFYLPQVVVGLLPWSLGLVAWRWRGAGPAARVALAAAAWQILFFSLSGSKRHVYLVPAYPPLALALGDGATRALAAGGPWRARLLAGLAALTCVVLLAGNLFWLPDYARQYALAPLLEALPPEAAARPLLCYPHGWASAAFSWEGAIEVIPAGHRPDLYQRLGRGGPQALLLRAGAEARGVLLGLPPSLTFDTCGSNAVATLVVVRPRAEGPLP
jgi:4-amino-4-deoxy-L-arabinose transferase-like glycosyltransferase